MKKYQMELVAKEIYFLSDGLLHMVLEPENGEMPAMSPGQFVEVGVDKSKTLLNRPFSIYNRNDNQLELLVKDLGAASSALREYHHGDKLRVIGPLGKGFCTDKRKPLLIGGGVGIAPLLYLARIYKEMGVEATIIFGNRTAPSAEIVDRLSKVAKVEICTDDGSMGFHGLVTDHPLFCHGAFDIVQCCGPLPMMKGVAAKSRKEALPCEVSLENKMACGLGACLCCVEPIETGNRCVCTDGPVFNINELKW